MELSDERKGADLVTGRAAVLEDKPGQAARSLAPPPIRGGSLPAVLWSKPVPEHLRVAGDDLVWVTRALGGSTDVWTLRIDELGRVAPRRLATFPVRFCDEEGPDCTVETIRQDIDVGAVVVAGEWIYLGHEDGVARIPRSGDAPTVSIPLDHDLACGERRLIRDLVVVGSQVLCTGEILTDDRGSRAVFVARMAPGMPVTACELPVTFREETVTAGVTICGRWGELHFAAHDDTLWFVFEDRLFRYRADELTALGGTPSELSKLCALPAGLFGVDGRGDLIALASETGAVLRTIMPDVPGKVESIAQTGEWISVTAWNGERTTILAARVDGSESRCVVGVEGRAGDLCSDDRFLYWSWGSWAEGCICRTPLDRDGAPLPVAAAVPQPAQGDGRRRPGLGRPAPADAATHALLCEVVAAAMDPTVTVPAHDRILLVPWCGWLFFALVSYRVAQLEVIRRLGGGTVRRSGRGVSWSDASVAKLTWSPSEGRAMTLRVHDVGDGIHAVVDPDWFEEWDFSEHIQQRRERCPIAARLWRWLPSRALIAKVAGWQIERFGGARVTSESPTMLRLPAALEHLAQRQADATARALDLDGDWSRISYWLGDPEVTRSGNAGWCERIRVQHRQMIDDMIDIGETAVADALPVLFDAPGLTAACDRLLVAYGENPPWMGLDAVVRLLRAHPDAPPSQALRRLIAEVTPGQHLDRFDTALPYLCERRIDLGAVRAKLRLLAGLDGRTVGYPVWVPSHESLLHMLVQAPEAGRAALRAGLVHEYEFRVEEAAGLLIAIAAPWSAAMLAAALGVSPHQATVEAALGWLGLRSVPPSPESRLEWKVTASREYLEQLPTMQRDGLSLHVNGVDN